ncbi:hypothetical protein BS47DRAFT_1338433 [Hydnum rufescens UP504]|uniref:Protein N-terminal glutamine amidohydrolase n=1 Tax=Hydnum rufescens UP504 TaxID=1448309 RepID=A0A9P6B5M8_9AGAM|nr:hypothetical protein BS47DRAFT_1338433 [Hydnum rufescens UP504]
MTYTAQYCEENIYLLAKSFCSEEGDHRQSYAVFISNVSRNVALFNQQASQAPQLPVLWDYHVLLLTVESRQTPNDDLTVSIWDYDTRLGFPCPFDVYMIGTFPDIISDISASCGLDLVSHFRVVPTSDFLDHFASDRSHMVYCFSRPCCCSL